MNFLAKVFLPFFLCAFLAGILFFEYTLLEPTLNISPLSLKKSPHIREVHAYLPYKNNEQYRWHTITSSLFSSPIDTNYPYLSASLFLRTQESQDTIVPLSFLLIKTHTFKEIQPIAMDHTLTVLTKKYPKLEWLEEEVIFPKTSLDKLVAQHKPYLQVTDNGMYIDSRLTTDLISLAHQYFIEQKEPLTINSAYRSFVEQKGVFENYTANKIGNLATPAGTSEHHLGTAIDFGGGIKKEENYLWLGKNAIFYGFLQSYTAPCQKYTYISPEKWHFRWIGRSNTQEYSQLLKKNPHLCPVQYLRNKTTEKK